MNIDYSKKYQRKDNAEFTAQDLFKCSGDKVWYTIENGESMWCYESEFLARYELSEAAK